MLAWYDDDNDDDDDDDDDNDDDIDLYNFAIFFTSATLVLDYFHYFCETCVVFSIIL